MAPARRIIIVSLLCLSVSVAGAAEILPADPLFQSSEILDVRITTALTTLKSDRPFDEELPAIFEFTDSAGKAVNLDIKVRTRGRFRRQKNICRFPPIRLNFKTSQTKNTLFHKQDKVKLVTHCQASSAYEQVLLREYAAYRLLNELTDTSFRVRLLRITYIDTEKKDRETEQFGFIIEHKNRLAKRLQKSLLEIPKITPDSLDGEYSNIVSLFHYLIGNTDFSSIQGSSGGNCCHNHVLFQASDEPIMSVPYDFDQAGLVDAPHAGPNPMFKIRSVRQRLYRGRCIYNEHLPGTIAKFQDKRPELMDVLNEVETTSNGSLRSMTRFIEDFYKTLESEKHLNSRIITKCI